MPPVAAGQIMGFEWITWDIEAGFDRGDAVITIIPTGTLRRLIPNV